MEFDINPTENKDGFNIQCTQSDTGSCFFKIANEESETYRELIVKVGNTSYLTSPKSGLIFCSSSTKESVAFTWEVCNQEGWEITKDGIQNRNVHPKNYSTFSLEQLYKSIIVILKNWRLR
jgi:hypothetical protein